MREPALHWHRMDLGDSEIAVPCLKNPPEPPACENCGHEAAAVIEGKGWCVDCFHESGSCCSGE